MACLPPLGATGNPSGRYQVHDSTLVSRVSEKYTRTHCMDLVPGLLPKDKEQFLEFVHMLNRVSNDSFQEVPIKSYTHVKRVEHILQRVGLLI